MGSLGSSSQRLKQGGPLDYPHATHPTPAQVYECLAALEGTAAAAQRALDAAARGETGAGADTLSPYFGRVRGAMRTFEDRLWATVRQFRVLGRDNPAALVEAARVVEAQEAVDRHLEAAGPGEAWLIRRWTCSDAGKGGRLAGGVSGRGRLSMAAHPGPSPTTTHPRRPQAQALVAPHRAAGDGVHPGVVCPVAAALLPAGSRGRRGRPPRARAAGRRPRVSGGSGEGEMGRGGLRGTEEGGPGIGERAEARPSPP